MSWRRFEALLTGLSPNAALVAVMTSRTNIITDPEEAERAVERLWR